MNQLVRDGCRKTSVLDRGDHFVVIDFAGDDHGTDAHLHIFVEIYTR
jgi:hypothetical protein